MHLKQQFNSITNKFRLKKALNKLEKVNSSIVKTVKSILSRGVRGTILAILSVYRLIYGVLRIISKPFIKANKNQLFYLASISLVAFAVITRVTVANKLESEIEVQHELLQEKEEVIGTLEEKENTVKEQLELKEEKLEEAETDIEKLEKEQEKKDAEIKKLEAELQAKLERQAQEALLASVERTVEAAASTVSVPVADISRTTGQVAAASSVSNAGSSRSIVTNYGQTLNFAPGTEHNTYPYGQCTYYVASQTAVPNYLGDARNWRYSLANYGWTVSETPIAGSIATRNNHVAYVNSVNGDGTITISEMNRNYDLDNINWRTISTSGWVFLYQ